MTDSLTIRSSQASGKLVRLNKASSHGSVQTNTASSSSNSAENNSSPSDFVGNVFKGIGNFFGSIFKGTFGWIVDAALSPIKFLIGAATIFGLTYLFRKPLGNFFKLGERFEKVKTSVVKSVKDSFKPENKDSSK